MRDHISILGWLFIVLNGLYLLAGIGLLLLMLGIGGLAGASGGHDGLAAFGIMGTIGMVVCGIFGVLALPGLLAGWGLLNHRQWGRVLTLILALLNILAFPVGTAIGIYAFVVLLNPETSAIFDRRAAY